MRACHCEVAETPLGSQHSNADPYRRNFTYLAGDLVRVAVFPVAQTTANVSVDQHLHHKVALRSTLSDVAEQLFS